MKKQSVFLILTLGYTAIFSGCGGGSDSPEEPVPSDQPETKEDQHKQSGFAPETLSGLYLIETVSVIRTTRDQYYYFKDENTCEFYEKSTGPASSIYDDILLTDKEGIYEAAGTYQYAKTGPNNAKLKVSASGTWTNSQQVSVPYTRTVTMNFIFNNETSVLANSEELSSSGGTKNGSRNVYFILSKTPK